MDIDGRRPRPTNTRRANYLAFVIEAKRRSDCVAGERGKRLHVALVWSPDDGFEVEQLWSNTARVVRTGLREAGDLPAPVDNRGPRVVPTQRRECGHCSILPTKTPTQIRRVGTKRAEVLVKGIRLGCLGVSSDDLVILDRKTRCAVCPPERSEVDRGLATP